MTFIRKVSDVTGIGMKQEINEKSVLFIALSDDGLINRQGNGNPANTQNDLFVGKASPAIFEVVLGSSDGGHVGMHRTNPRASNTVSWCSVQDRSIIRI